MSYQKLKELDQLADQLGYNTKGESLLARLIPYGKTQETSGHKPRYVIAVDFDGTVVTHEFPHVGKETPYCVNVLKKLVAHGAGLVLFTMRSGEYLEQAVSWFAERDIPLYGINENPGQAEWTSSPKCYAHLYIDDAGLNIPLKREPSFSKRPFVDWKEVDYFLKHHDYYVEPLLNP